jgi:hypothetical protein
MQRREKKNKREAWKVGIFAVLAGMEGEALFRLLKTVRSSLLFLFFGHKQIQMSFFLVVKENLGK